MPASVRSLPDDKYDKWYSVYSSARDEGKSKESAAKIAWSQVKKESANKKDKMRKFVKEVVKNELSEAFKISPEAKKKKKDDKKKKSSKKDKDKETDDKTSDNNKKDDKKGEQ